MKIAVADLKKAIKWVEENSKDVHVNVQMVDQLFIKCQDKYGVQVEIKIFAGGTMLAKIIKEDNL